MLMATNIGLFYKHYALTNAINMHILEHLLFIMHESYSGHPNEPYLGITRYYCKSFVSGNQYCSFFIWTMLSEVLKVA